MKVRRFFSGYVDGYNRYPDEKGTERSMLTTAPAVVVVKLQPLPR